MDIPVNFRTVDAGKCSDAVVRIILEGPLPLVTESSQPGRNVNCAVGKI